jgi:hypothetical protein
MPTRSLAPALLVCLVVCMVALAVMVMWNSVPALSLSPAVVPIASSY